jgi:putative phage-type endonuclease
MNVVRMAQGSPEWHAHRRKFRNASETPIVLGISPWTTPHQLWQLKLGLVEQVVSPAMQRGTELEPVARAAYERQTGHVMQPLVVVDGEYSASLDGMTLGGERIVEIKCPVKGRDSTLYGRVGCPNTINSRSRTN